MRIIPTTIGVVSAALLGLTVWGCFGISHHLIVAVDKWGNAAPDLKPTIAKVNQALDTTNAPCAIKGSNQPCRGTLGLLNKTIKDTGDAIIETQLQERSTAPHITAAMDTLNNSAQKLGGTADNLSGTATALTGTANAATRTLTTATTTIAAFQPVLGHLDASSADLDAFLKGKMLTKTLPDIAVNLKITTGNVAEMTTDSATWYHKWLHPDKKKLTFVGGVDATTLWIHSHILPPLF
jgi:hypothetical protein